MVLLVAAGLFIRSLGNAQAVDLGFEEEKIAFVSTNLDMMGYTNQQGHQYLRTLAERVASLPGVQSISYTERVPLNLTTASQDFTIEGYEPPSGEEEVTVQYGSVGPGYFETMGIPLVSGREFTEADAEGAPQVVIVNQEFARRFWPGENPLGKRISAEGRDGPWIEVVGVSADYKVITVGEEPRPFVQLAFLQQDPFFQALVVRTVSDPGPMVSMVRREMLALDRET
ncbi:MAG: ABC transporter permease, partial [Acidobacteriota bacterium]